MQGQALGWWTFDIILPGLFRSLVLRNAFESLNHIFLDNGQPTADSYNCYSYADSYKCKTSELPRGGGGGGSPRPSFQGHSWAPGLTSLHLNILQFLAMTLSMWNIKALRRKCQSEIKVWQMHEWTSLRFVMHVSLIKYFVITLYQYILFLFLHIVYRGLTLF